jgi:hypothetical protein
MGESKMATQFVEMAGGLIKFALACLVLWAVAEVGCKIFFWVREREGK